MKNDLKNLNKEFRKCAFDCEILDLSFINSKKKKYKIADDKDDKKFTLYEYCILLQKYKYIKHYCHYILKSIYTTDKYFEYCKMGNT